jgi:DNA repair exonuclease SbcCD nuclease subunit
MSKILLWTNAHIHPHKKSNERLKDCLDAQEWVFKVAQERKIEHLVFLGDLFHDRQKIDVASYQWTFQLFQKYLVGTHTRVYLLLGNHDLFHANKYDISSVRPLDAIPNVTVIGVSCTLSIANHWVSFLPYTENPLEDLSRLEAQNDAPYKVLCGHLAVHGATLNFNFGTKAEVGIEQDGGMTLLDSSKFSAWDWVFLGHYHGHQIIDDKVEYVGSPLQLSFGEAFQKKHVIIYDLETHEKEYVENDFSPKHYIIPVSDLDKYDLENNFIRLEVEDLSSSDVVEVKTDLKTQHNLGSLEICQKPRTEQDKQIVTEAQALIAHDPNIIEKYVDATPDSWQGMDRDKLIGVGKRIMAMRGSEQ